MIGLQGISLLGCIFIMELGTRWSGVTICWRFKAGIIHQNFIDFAPIFSAKHPNKKQPNYRKIYSHLTEKH